MSDARGRALRKLQARLGYRWQQRQLLLQALRHPSFTRGNRAESNQRMEFVGDSIIDLVVAIHLMRLHPGKDEGFLTQARTKMVNDEALASKGRDLGLHRLIEIQQSAPHLRDLKSTAADCMEAVVGSAFIDSNESLNVAFNVIRNAGILG